MWQQLIKMKSPNTDMSGKEEKKIISSKDLMALPRPEFDKFLKEHEVVYDYVLNVYEYYKKPAVCNHNWAEYIGFTERYDYCTKCDLKDRK